MRSIRKKKGTPKHKKKGRLSFYLIFTCIILFGLSFVLAGIQYMQTSRVLGATTGPTANCFWLNPLCYFKKPPTSLGVSTTLLPGEQIWNNGVSSLLFGTSNTYEYSIPNIMTEPSIQQQLKQAGFTLLRTDFYDRVNYWQPADPVKNPWPSDSQIEARIKISENIGAQCLGDIYSPNVAFAKHLVAYLGQRCNMYEFGNEPNTSGGLYSYTIADYLTLWNSAIPQLRAINPNAKFFGPTLDYNGSKTSPNGMNQYMQAFLTGVKTSGVLPDGLSFHFYPCLNAMTSSQCLLHATDATSYISNFRSMTQKTLGKSLPIGVSEWNVFSAPPYPAYSIDPAGTFQTAFAKTVLTSFINAKLDFATQFDAANGGATKIIGGGFLDLFDVYNKNDNPKPQFYVIRDMIRKYNPAFITPTVTIAPHCTVRPPCLDSGFVRCQIATPVGGWCTPTIIPVQTLCPAPQTIHLTSYCGGTNKNLSRVILQWSNVNPINKNVYYNMEFSYNPFHSQVQPRLLPSTGTYWNYHVTGSGQSNGYAYANYPLDPNTGFDTANNKNLYVRITYIQDKCSTNTVSSTAQVALAVCQ